MSQGRAQSEVISERERGRLGGRESKTAEVASMAARAATAARRAEQGHPLADMDRSSLERMQLILDQAATAAGFGSDPSIQVPEQSSFTAIAVTIDAAAEAADSVGGPPDQRRLVGRLKDVSKNVRLVLDGSNEADASSMVAFFSILSQHAVRDLGSVGERSPRF